MVTPMGDLPLRVRKVKLVGNNRTKPYVVEDQLQVGWFSLPVWGRACLDWVKLMS